MANTHSPNRPTINANAWPVRPVACVARLRSPVRHQISARAIRPPSSGNAGTTLNTNSAALMKPSHPSSASAGVVLRLPLESATSETVPLLASRVIAPRHSANSTSVTSGPRRGDLELLAGAGGLASHAREPAEGPQVDADDLDSQPTRHQRVPELVQDERREVAERTGDGDRVRGRL